MIIYKPHKTVTEEMLINNGFKNIDGFYSYKFPVYKDTKKTSLLWGVINLDLENKYCYVTVVNSANNIYAAFHNREYGKNEVVTKIDQSIAEQINKFVKAKILYKGEK